MNRLELQALSEIRIKEARVLLDAGFSDGAYYLAGYSVECALKACIAKRTQQHDFPDKKLVNESHTHSLMELIRIAELSGPREESIARDASMKIRWAIVLGWSETSRYQRNNVAAADALLKAVDDGREGILPWIRLRW
jgi:HEPN domain-containing protein